jgi:hypothetical protein
MRWAGHGSGEKMYKVLVGKTEGKRPLERPRCKWYDGISMGPREMGWGCGLDSTGSAYGDVVNAVMNLWVLAPRN